jgi:branched-chain amino acid transport system substrate-binding protein
MRRVLSGFLAGFLGVMLSAMATAAIAQGKPPLKLGGILDMSGLYADITGAGAEMAAKMAAEDFGGEVLGRKIEILAADHLNKADLAANIARDMLDNQGVEMIYDVAASATALAAGEIAKARNKIIMFSGPGSIRLSNEACGPYTVHYVFDTYSQANVTGLAAVKRGLDTWFFITADYAFGHDLEKDTVNVVQKSGGKVLGDVRHPLNSSDFSSYLLQAQASKAKVLALCNGGADMVGSVKQAREFGLHHTMTIVSLLSYDTDIRAIGLDAAQGLLATQTYYWDLNERTRAFNNRIRQKTPTLWPNMANAGLYSSTLHYLKAVADMDQSQAKNDGAAVIARMKAMPTDDDAFGQGQIREDGRKLHAAYLMAAKSPSESTGPYDVLKLIASVPADQAFRPLSEGGYPLVKS